MEKNTFNLKTFRKQAFYDGAKGQITNQSRCMMNCFKSKMENGKTKGEAQESWFGCLEEYNTAKSKSDWAIKYSSH